jgi:hypothetical protein
LARFASKTCPYLDESVLKRNEIAGFDI